MHLVSLCQWRERSPQFPTDTVTILLNWLWLGSFQVHQLISNRFGGTHCQAMISSSHFGLLDSRFKNYDHHSLSATTWNWSLLLYARLLLLFLRLKMWCATSQCSVVRNGITSTWSCHVPLAAWQWTSQTEPVVRSSESCPLSYLENNIYLKVNEGQNILNTTTSIYMQFQIRCMEP